MKVPFVAIISFFLISLITSAQAPLLCDSVIMNDGTVKMLNVQEITRNKVVYFLCCENCAVPRELKKKDVDTVVYNTQKEKSEESAISENIKPITTPNAFQKAAIKRYSFYLEGTLPFGYWDVESYANYGFSTIGIGISFGNKWYLSKNEHYKTGVIVNYARGEFTKETGYLDPLHIGWANAWQRRNGSVVEFNLYGGPRLNFDNINSVGLGITPELKFRIKGALIGIAYDSGREIHSESLTQLSKTTSHMLRFSARFFK